MHGRQLRYLVCFKTQVKTKLRDSREMNRRFQIGETVGFDRTAELKRILARVFPPVPGPDLALAVSDYVYDSHSLCLLVQCLGEEIGKWFPWHFTDPGFKNVCHSSVSLG